MTDSVRVDIVPPDKVAAVWPKVAGGIAQGCAHSHGFYTPESLHALATASPPRAFVIVAYTPAEILASGVAVISEYPGQKAIEVIVVGGKKRARWIELLDARLVEWARAEGAAYVMFTGRKGWARSGLPDGWRPLAQTFGKKVEPARVMEEAA